MNTLMNKFSKSALALSIAGAITLASCGGTDQDTGTPTNFKQVFSGVAVDGYLARSTVFIDSNNNGTRDAWEAWAFTDNDGYYSYNPKTDTDYCASGASAQEQQYCLISNVEYSNVVIRIDAGYDVLTGEPFLGQMSRRVNAEVQEEVTDSVVSPITSLLSNVESESDRSALLTSLSISEDDLDVDYLNSDSTTDNVVDTQLLNTALKIHKVVAVLSDRLTDTYTEIGEDFGTPNDASSAVYPNLAEQIIAAGTSLDVALSDETTLVSALDAAENSLREVYERKEFTLPADMGSASNPQAFERVVEVASEFSAVVNTLIDVNDTTFSLEDATAGTRALETLVIKTVEETQTVDTSIDNVIDFFDVNEGDTQKEELVDSLLASLSLESADIDALTNNDFSGSDFDSVEEISQVASLGDDVQAFTAIGGKAVKVSNLDLGDFERGAAATFLKDSEVEFYFQGDSDDVDGAFLACVKHIDGAKPNGTLGEGNTRGELVEGFWSLLGASEANQESYSLLITITFLGTTYQAIMKPAGEETRAGVDYTKIRFDFDSSLFAYHSEDGFTDIVSLPTSNEACADSLPSRVGI